MLKRTQTLIESGMAAGWHIGAQLYLSRNGKPVAEVAGA